MKYSPYPSYKPSGVEWLGELPSDWKVMSLKRVVKIPITDGPHETPDFVNDGVPFVSAESVWDGRIHLEAIRGFFSYEAHKVYSRKYQPRKDDVYIVKSGSTTGKIATVASIAPELADLPADDAAMRLNSLLSDNRSRQTQRLQIEEQIEQVQQEIQESKATIQTMIDRLDSLCVEAKRDSHAELWDPRSALPGVAPGISGKIHGKCRAHSFYCR